MTISKKVNHGRVKEKYNPTPNAAERRYHAHVRDMGCLLCKKPPDIHHVGPDNHLEPRRDHMRVVPLCRPHHQGQGGYHDLGSVELFEEVHGIDLHATALELRANYEVTL